MQGTRHIRARGNLVHRVVPGGVDGEVDGIEVGGLRPNGIGSQFGAKHETGLGASARVRDGVGGGHRSAFQCAEGDGDAWDSISSRVQYLDRKGFVGGKGGFAELSVTCNLLERSENLQRCGRRAFANGSPHGYGPRLGTGGCPHLDACVRPGQVIGVARVYATEANKVGSAGGAEVASCDLYWLTDSSERPIERLDDGHVFGEYKVSRDGCRQTRLHHNAGRTSMSV